MHIAGGGELASEGAAEGVLCVDNGAAPAGSWQGWPGVEGVHAQELWLHAIRTKSGSLGVPTTAKMRRSCARVDC